MNYNIYCDESCHLEHDDIPVFVLGAVWCPQEKIREINSRIVSIKRRNEVRASSEIKWTKIAPVKHQLYLDIVDYFFDDDDIHFRGLLVPDKSKLRHEDFNQSHDEWYYKMYFDLLKVIFNPHDRYNVYLDYKDTNSFRRSCTLHDVCCNSMLDFSRGIINRVQPIRSHEVQIMQVVDILTGAVGYANRPLPEKSMAKTAVVDLIKERSGYSLERTTLYKESKFNLFVWEAQE
jgi:hypothetical protein